MIQSVHCPSCDTRYGLRRARVRQGLRRARCFRCRTEFSIEGEVLLLLGREAPEPVLELPAPAPAAIEAPPAWEPVATPPEPGPVSEPAAADPAPVVDLELPSLEELEEATNRLQPGETLQELEPVLSLDDLPGAEEEILDKTLIDYPAPPHPESRPTPPHLPPLGAEADDEETAGSGSYASAKDAIAKLLGETPPAAPAYRPPAARGGAQMDVEATLSALESTLAGTRSTAHGEAEPAPRPPALEARDLPPPASATVKLSMDDMAALQGAPAAPAAEPTLMLRVPASPLATPPGMDPNLLKVQVGTELFSNLTMEQLITMAEQGRLADYHMVARQFSDNWLEAGKVPGLRPVFERLRRQRMPEPPVSPLETAPIKKSLFGGLFGKGKE